MQEEFQLHFSLEEFDDPSSHITENIEVDWDDYKTRTFNGKEWFEFEVSQKKPVSYSCKGEIQGQFFTVLAHKSEDDIKFFINKMLSFSDGEGFTYFTIGERHYHGMVYLYNLKGEAEHLMHFEKGIVMHGIESVKVDTADSNNLGLISRGDCWEKGNTARCNSALDCALNGTNTGGGCGGGSSAGGSGWTPITTFHFTDWYNNHGNSWSYNGTTYDGHTTEWVWISGSGNGDSINSWGYAETSEGGLNPDGYSSGEIVYFDTPPEGTNINDSERVVLLTPPSCKSFKYQSVSADWQASVITDFKMKVKVGTMSNYQRYTISIPMLSFEVWSKDRFGNTLSIGAAAELSAESIQQASWDTVKEFQDRYGFSEYTVSKWFEDRLKQVFREKTDGGRVTRGNPYNLTPRKYTTAPTTGGCN